MTQTLRTMMTLTAGAALVAALTNASAQPLRSPAYSSRNIAARYFNAPDALRAPVLETEPTTPLLEADPVSPPLPPLPDDRILEPGGGGGLWIGPFAGIDWNIHTGTFSTTEGTFVCCSADGGSGLGLVGGVKAFIELSDRWSLSPRLLYEGRNGTFTGVPDTLPIFGRGQQVEMMVAEKQFEATMSTIGADLLVSYKLTDFGLYAAAGPSAAIIVAEDFRQTSTIASPTGVTFLDGSTSREVFHGDLPFLNNFQLAVRAGIGANIPLTENLSLNPEALYGFPLTKFSTSHDWRGHTIQGTLGLLFAF